MLDRSRILTLIPHAGASCLLDRVLAWSADTVACAAVSHLDERNPLRRAGRLATICGVEYGLQAAALHGALRDGEHPQPQGFVAALRDVELVAPRLDDGALGTLRVEADLVGGDRTGQIYRFRVLSEAGASLLSGRAAISVRSAEANGRDGQAGPGGLRAAAP